MVTRARCLHILRSISILRPCPLRISKDELPDNCNGMKDTGHYNCRDYYVQPGQHVVTNKIHSILSARQTQSASPINAPFKKVPSFQFFKLPLELRHKIYDYLLPSASSPKVENRPPSNPRKLVLSSPDRLRPVIWERGQTNLLCVSRRTHDECVQRIYGSNTFVVFVGYSSIICRFQWLLPSGLTPTTEIGLLETLPGRYLKLIRRMVIVVEHPDSYTGMIKYNVGGRGLTYGLQQQVKKLAQALTAGDGLTWLSVALLNGVDYLDLQRRGMGGSAEVQLVLEPLRMLRGVSSVSVSGAVTHGYARALGSEMRKRFDEDRTV